MLRGNSSLIVVVVLALRVVVLLCLVVIIAVIVTLILVVNCLEGWLHDGLGAALFHDLALGVFLFAFHHGLLGGGIVTVLTAVLHQLEDSHNCENPTTYVQ